MITAITIWVIGWMFCVGGFLQEIDGKPENKNFAFIIFVLALFALVWPMALGACVTYQILKHGKRTNASEEKP